MEFSELWFLFLFLPLTVIVFFLMPTLRSKNMFLLIASMVLYGLVQPAYLILLFVLTLVNYLCSKRIESRASLAVPIVLTVGILVCFKLIATVGGSFAELLVLPLGISYYTFGLVAYQVDIFRGKHAPAEKLTDLLLFAFVFPKIITGPIVRFSDFAPQLKKRRANSQTLFLGLERFVFGLAKKVLIADYCGSVIAACDDTGAGAWLSALMFMFQIYFEFSGCSDMAIGMAKIFGFTFCENFNLPYASTSVTDFWRRWHISLGSFFRDYVYIPLGGNRKGKLRQILNMFIVWSLTGLWHGTSLNYLLWGVYFFVLLAVEKQIKLERIPKCIRWGVTSILILFGWVIFSGQSIVSLFAFDRFWSSLIGVQLRNSAPLLLTCIIGASPIPKKIGELWRKIRHDDEYKLCARNIIVVLGSFMLVAGLLILCTVSLIGATNAPDIYGGKLR